MAVGLLKDVLKDMKTGIFDFTKDGKCSNCGQCCSNFLPMSDSEIDRIKKYVRRHQIKEQRHFIPLADPFLDFTCPFRNNSEKRCVIYDVRPAICRDFQCDKPKKGIWANRDMYHGKYGDVNVRETFFGDC